METEQTEQPVRQVEDPILELVGSEVVKHTPNIQDWAAAMATAMGQMEAPAATKEARVHSRPPENRYLYSYWYADLWAVRAVMREPLATNGLVVNQYPGWTDGDPRRGMLLVETWIVHRSGQLFVSRFHLAMKEDGWVKPQDVGTVSTYACRYPLIHIFGLESDGEDTDGSGDSGRTRPNAPPPQGRRSNSEIASEAAARRAKGGEGSPGGAEVVSEIARTLWADTLAALEDDGTLARRILGEALSEATRGKRGEWTGSLVGVEGAALTKMKKVLAEKIKAAKTEA